MPSDDYVHRGPGEVVPVILPATHCLIWDCRKPIHARGYCRGHFEEWDAPRRRTGMHGDEKIRPACTRPDCEAPGHAQGLCKPHYNEVYNRTRRAKRAANRAAGLPRDARAA